MTRSTSSKRGHTDPLYEEIKVHLSDVDVITGTYIQKHFGIGYVRAARIVERLESESLIGKPYGSRGREVFHGHDPKTKVRKKKIKRTYCCGKVFRDDDGHLTYKRGRKSHKDPVCLKHAEVIGQYLRDSGITDKVMYLY